MKINKKLVITSIAGTLAVAGAALSTGVAYAQTSNTNTDNLFSRVAQILGVDSTKLQSAVKQASTEKVDQDLKDGKISQDQADKIKQNIADGKMDKFGMGMREDRGGRGGGRMMGQDFDEIAGYLGITKTDLMSQLKDGKKLVDIAKDKGKSSDDLKEFLKKATSEKFSQEVKDGKLTQSEADKRLANLDSMIQNIIDGNIPKPHMMDNNKSTTN